MRKSLRFSLFPVYCLLFPAAGGASALPPWPQISAQSALVADAESGQTLFEKTPDAKSFPASLTKILTALILLESPQQTQWARVPSALPRLTGTNIGLKPGDAIFLPDLAKAILIASANDAAFTAACHLAGNPEKFADLMNQKAASLGLKNSHFVNPHGLHDPGHYSTARDLTLLASAALQNQEFRRLVATQSASVIVVSSEGPRQLALESPNKLLTAYPGCDGVKSGFTREAGRCLIASATRDGWQVIATVLKSKDAFNDATALLDYTFQNFRALRLAEAGKPLTLFPVSGGPGKKVAAVPAEELRLIVQKEARLETRLLPQSSPLPAPIRVGGQVGTFLVLLDGQQVASLPLLAGQNIPLSRLPSVFRDNRFLLALVLFALATALAMWAAKSRRTAR